MFDFVTADDRFCINKVNCEKKNACIRLLICVFCITKGDIVIYQTNDGKTSIDVKLEDQTVWLNQMQMVELFGLTKQNISLHINNIFKENELERSTTVKESLTVQEEGKRKVQRKIEYFSLDVIISVVYRVKSQRGTQFRIWANQVLKEYLTRGYAIDQKRFQEQSRQLEELKQTVKLLGNVVGNHSLTSDEATGLLKVVTDYTYALDVLDQYDHQVLEIHDTTAEELFQITYDEAMNAINGLRDKFGGSWLFGIPYHVQPSDSY